jgi:hypothetical protein
VTNAFEYTSTTQGKKTALFLFAPGCMMFGIRQSMYWMTMATGMNDALAAPYQVTYEKSNEMETRT